MLWKPFGSCLNEVAGLDLDQVWVLYMSTVLFPLISNHESLAQLFGDHKRDTTLIVQYLQERFRLEQAYGEALEKLASSLSAHKLSMPGYAHLEPES
jgi:hypothetical protein